MANQEEIYNQLKAGLPVPTSQWSNSRLQVAGTYTIVKSTGGLLRTVSFEALSCPSLTIYDNASGCSGTVIALMDAGLPAGNYLYDYSFTNGMTINIQAGNTPCVRLTYK